MKIIKKIILKIFTSAFVLVFLISSHILIGDYNELKETNKDNKQLKEYVIKDDTTSNEVSINWTELSKVNKDIIGWIKIEGTNIDYPILKDTDKLYYLNHSFNKKLNKNGSIFTMDSKLFKNKETIIYGHNMNNKAMFSELERYINKSFFDSHRNFKIYTPSGEYDAIIFSCYSINENEEKNNIERLSFNEQLSYYKTKSKFNIDDIGDICKIVKLSTCSYINSTTTPTSERCYIIAKITESR